MIGKVKMKRIFFFILISIASPTFAAALQLFGVAKNGEKALIKEGDYRLEKENNGRGPIYVGPPQYGYCFLSASDMKGEFLVQCSKKIGEPPTLVYKSDLNEEQTRYHPKALAIYKKYFGATYTAENESRDYAGYYRCVKGCQRKYADLLVKVLYSD